MGRSGISYHRNALLGRATWRLLLLGRVGVHNWESIADESLYEASACELLLNLIIFILTRFPDVIVHAFSACREKYLLCFCFHQGEG